MMSPKIPTLMISCRSRFVDQVGFADVKADDVKDAIGFGINNLFGQGPSRSAWSGFTEQFGDIIQPRLTYLAGGEPPDISVYSPNRRVLLCVHGYNSDWLRVQARYVQLIEQIAYRDYMGPYLTQTPKSWQTKPSTTIPGARYDCLIGYLWPSGLTAGPIGWITAKAQVREAAKRLRTLLGWLNTINVPVTISAHSLGCAVALRALEGNTDSSVQKVILAGAAVPYDELRSQGDGFGYGAGRVKVAYSGRDRVLKYAYRALHPFTPALGSRGLKPGEQYAANIEAFDLTSSVFEHGGYNDSDDFVRLFE